MKQNYSLLIALTYENIFMHLILGLPNANVEYTEQSLFPSERRVALIKKEVSLLTF